MLYLRESIANLEKWIENLGLSELLYSEALQRLKNIRFLGIMKYITKLHENYSRYEHTLAVAKLAEIFCKQVGVNELICKKAIIMGLLHDIGHMPFSHGSEVFFRTNWGKYHTAHSLRMGKHLIRSLIAYDKGELASLVSECLKLLSTKKNNIESFESNFLNILYHSELSVDNLDGMNRAAYALGYKQISPYDIIEGIFLFENKLYLNYSALGAVIDLFRFKKLFYDEYVYSSKGLAAEAMLTRTLELAFANFKLKDDFLTLNDNRTQEICYATTKSRELLLRLENQNIFALMSQVAPEKNKLLIALLRNNKTANKYLLEKEIVNFIPSLDPANFILHSTIKINFHNNMSKQQNLFDDKISLLQLQKEFSTTRTFEESIEFCFPVEYAESICKMSIPTNVFNEIKNNSVDNISENNLHTAILKYNGVQNSPFEIASFLTSWAIRKKQDTLLDPSSGSGIFLQCGFKRLLELGASSTNAMNQILGYEENSDICQSSFQQWPFDNKLKKENVLNIDFFDIASKLFENNSPKVTFDAIIGNPPYIGYHQFSGVQREKALKLSADLGITLSGRCSSWAPFLIIAANLLGFNGRLGMVLPIELLTADYAKAIRQFLTSRFKSIKIILFNKSIFPQVQQDVLLLLASNCKPAGVWYGEVENERYLTKEKLNELTKTNLTNTWLGSKWSCILAKPTSLKVLEEIIKSNQVYSFQNVWNVRIGVVTGNNKYFILNNSEVKKFRINHKWLSPIITNAKDIPGATFCKKDYEKIDKADKRCHLLNIDHAAQIRDDPKLFEYLESGKRKGLNNFYKCRTRWPWYSVPQQAIPEIFLTYMSGNLIRMVLNTANVNSTNTIHNVNFKNNIPAELKKPYLVSFYNTVTMLSAELIGRAYGGGVLKLELAEVRQLLVPNLTNMKPNLLRRLTDLLTVIDNKLRSNSIDFIDDIDEIVLIKHLGIHHSIVSELIAERQRLKCRRMLRVK